MPSPENELLNQFRRELVDATDKMSADVEQFFQTTRHPDKLPSVIYHFTDCDGVIGILSQRTLRGSLATSLSDTSETRYAISRLRERVQSGEGRLTHLPKEVVTNFLDSNPTKKGLTRDVRAYVVSFCAADAAAHWLHYGRSGTGVAIGFDAAKLAVDPFELYPVIYDPERQDELLSWLLRRVDSFVGQFVGRSGRIGRFVIDAGAFLLLNYLRLFAPHVKDPAFQAENEWRLISTEQRVEDNPPNQTETTKFRSVSGRVVPYKEIEFREGLPITELVLGASCPMRCDEQALAVLMENTLGRTYPVRRSAVSVRP
jgi:hypothetical protein